MAGDWQIYVALFIVAVSVAFLLRRVVRLVRERGSGCTGCASRPAGKSDSQVVTLRHLR